MKREEMIGFIVRSLDNMMMRNAVGDEKSEKKGMMPVMQGHDGTLGGYDPAI